MRRRNGNGISFSQLHKSWETCCNFNTIWRWHSGWHNKLHDWYKVIGFLEEMYFSLPTQRLGPFQTVCQKTAAGSTWTGWESNVCVLSLSISLSLCSARSSPPFFSSHNMAGPQVVNVIRLSSSPHPHWTRTHESLLYYLFSLSFKNLVAAVEKIIEP